MEENGSVGTGSIVWSFFLGGLIGAGVGLLIAPKTGIEMRGEIRNLAHTAAKSADDYYGQIAEMVASTLDSSKDLLDDKKALIAKAVEAGIALYQQKQTKTESRAGEPASSTR